MCPLLRSPLLSQEHPELLDAVLFPCARCSSLLRRRPSLFGNVSQALSDYSGFKYVVDLDGGTHIAPQTLD